MRSGSPRDDLRRAIAGAGAVASVALFASLSCAGCDDEHGGPPSGDAGFAPTDGGRFHVEAPVPVLPPVLTPCPAGWVLVTDELVGERCEPFGSEPRDCAGEEAHFAGDGECARVGSVCPSDGLPEIAAGTAVLYVSASAPAGGDGTRSAPFSRIGDALARAVPGTTVAVGAGRYDEALAPGAGVRLVGACVEQTVLTSSTTDPVVGVVQIESAGVGIANLRIARPARPGIIVSGDGADVALEDVVIDGASEQGLLVWDRGNLSARNLVIRGTRAAGEGPNGEGLVIAGAAATIERAVIERNQHAGVLIDRATVSLEDVVVRDTAIDPSGPDDGARGIQIQESSRVTLHRVAILGSEGYGLSFERQNAVTVTASHLVIRDVRPLSSNGEDGHGIRLGAGTALVLSRALIEDVATHGILVFGGRTEALTTLDVSDTVVRDVRADGLGRFGRGLGVEHIATLRAERVAIERAVEVGVVVSNEPAAADIRDLRVRDVEALPDGSFGHGVQVQHGARLDVERIDIEHTRTVAMGVVDAVATIRDLRVANVRSRASDLRMGEGVIVLGASDVTLARGVVEHAREVGVAVIGPLAALNATHLRVSDTAERDCASSTCSDFPHGDALAVGDATVTIADFLLERSAQCGVLLGTAELDLFRGQVRENLIGACVGVPGYDLERLSNSVAYIDNGAPLESPELPVPDVSTMPISPSPDEP